jgi:hypothetical protein
LDEKSLVTADFVADDVDFSPWRLAGNDVFEGSDELLIGSTRGGLARHFARQHLKRMRPEKENPGSTL